MVERTVLSRAKAAAARLWACALVLALALGASLCAAPAHAYAGEEAGSVVLSVIGVDDVEAEKPLGVMWVAPQETPFAADATAWDVLKPALDEAGCTYDAQDSTYGIFVQSITSPEGLMLENTDAEPYSFWSFLVNGEPAAEGVSSYKLQDGDQIELMYYPNGEAPAVEAVPAGGEEAIMPISADAEAANPDSAPANTGVMLAVGGGVLVVVALVVVYALKVRKRKQA